MKILIINFEYPPLGGGGGVATQQIAEALAVRHDVHVLTTRMPDLASYEKLAGVQLHRVRVLGRTARPTASLLSLITFVPSALWIGFGLTRRMSFDVINAQFVVPSGVVGMVLAKLFRIPLVVSFIGGDLYDPSKGTSPHRHGLLRWIVRRVSAVAVARTAISDDTRKQAQELHGVTQPITVTHLGIKSVHTTVLSRGELGLPADAPVFISIGRLIPRKNYRLLLRAWAQISDAHLVIVGSGPQEDELKRSVQELGLTKRVHLSGFISETKKRQYLLAADGYVSATEHEGFGLVFLEAMHAGLPIVATNRGGQTDFLIDGENGYLVAPGNADQLADAVRRLLSDPAQAQAMARRNEHDVQRFLLTRTTAEFERVLVSAGQLQS